MQDKIIGIDLGTTNSEVAIVENGQVTVLEVEHSKLLPSVVGVDENDKILVGKIAQNQYVLYPERTIKSVKRSMGSDESIILGHHSFLPQEISALILKKLKAVAEKHLAEPVNKAVITVPAYFSDKQRQATREAGEIAGLEVVRIINEPTAAALAYQIDTEFEKKILVYDLGGGTFDVSVVSIQQGVTEVLSSHGNNLLGGDDFDAKICSYLQDKLKDLGVKWENDLILQAKINRIAEESKCHLSNEPFVVIEEEYITEVKKSLLHPKSPIHLKTELSRDDYEKMIQPYIDETMESVHTALEDAKLTIADIDEILLVGGSTRTPLIQNSLASLLGKRPHNEMNPDLCVASGAAIQAANIAGESIASILVDITPYTFGTSALGEIDGEFSPWVYVPIIHRNTALPCKKTEIFYTAIDQQSIIEINIFEGEEKNAMSNISLGQFTISELSDEPKGNPIIITLELDLDGILTVTAKEKNTSTGGTLTINNAMKQRDERDIEQTRDKINAVYETGENTDKVAISSIENNNNKDIVQAQDLIKKAKAMLNSLNEEDKEDVIDIIEAINDAIHDKNMDALSTSQQELTDIIYYMEN